MTEPIKREVYVAELSAASERVAGESLPPHLRALTERHLARLETLLEAMRGAGVDEDLMRHSVREIIDSYEAHLIEVLVHLSKEK